MGLFGKILKTGFDVVTLPIDVVKEVDAAMSGDPNSPIKDKANRILEDLEEVRDEINEL
jgi:hypothetical protein